jgi:tyrosyl-tRNA synthetase
MKNTMRQRELDIFFERGVDQFVDPDNSFKKKLLDKIENRYPKNIIIKWGVDPTRPDIHLGHAVVLRKLRQLQDWGCKVVFLIGDFTAEIGDPTGKSRTRPEVEQKEIENNLKTYLEQTSKILKLDPKTFSWIRNSDWFTSITDLNLPEDYKVNLEIKQAGRKLAINIPPNSFVGKAVVFEKSRMQVTKLGLKDKIMAITLRGFLWNLKQITLPRLIERNMFQERIKKGETLRMHEIMYPVLQGIDSQVLSQIYGSCDLEVGGSDQLFNMLIGREMMKFNKQEPQSVLAFKLLVGLDGKDKMSKSQGNYIGITEPPQEIFGKIMSISDHLIPSYFEFCTYTPLEEIKKISSSLKNAKENPRDLKLRLAEEIAIIYHGEIKAKEARENFLKVFQKKDVPSDLETIKVETNTPLSDLLLKEKAVKSKSEFRRLILAGAISNLLSKDKITNPDFKISEDSVFKIGKKTFLKVSVNKKSL